MDRDTVVRLLFGLFSMIVLSFLLFAAYSGQVRPAHPIEFYMMGALLSFVSFMMAAAPFDY